MLSGKNLLKKALFFIENSTNRFTFYATTNCYETYLKD